MAVSLMIVGVAVACGLSYYLWPSGPELPPALEPPNPDTSAFQRFVREKIAERRSAAVMNPDSAEAWGKLGMAFDAHNLVSEAAVCYGQAEAIDPDDFRWPYMLAICLPEADPAFVAEVFARAQSLERNYEPVNLRLGQALLRAGDPPGAKRYFAAALTVNENSSHALVGLATIALRKKNFQSASELLERALRADRRHGEAYRLLARAYRGLRMDDRAAAAARSAVRFPSKTPMLDPARSEVMLEGATVSHLVRQASLLRKDGDYGGAIRKLRQSLEVKPDDLQAHFQLGLALFFGLDKREEGLRELREAIRIDPSFRPAGQALRDAEARVRSERP